MTRPYPYALPADFDPAAEEWAPPEPAARRPRIPAGLNRGINDDGYDEEGYQWR